MCIHIKDILLFIVCGVAGLALGQSDELSDLLLFASPGGDGRSQGFYALDINSKNSGVTAKNMRRISYDCLNVAAEDLAASAVKSINLDAATGKALVHVEQQQGSMQRVTLFRVPLCEQLVSVCDAGEGNHLLEPILLDVTSYTHRLTAFVSHGDRVYFVSERDEPARGLSNKKRRTIELRELSGCEGRQPPFTTFDVDTCSRRVATLKIDEFKHFARYSATSGLAVVPKTSAPNGDDVMFFTQLHRLEKRSNQRNNNVRASGAWAGAQRASRSSAFLLRHVSLEGEVTKMYEEYVSDEHTKYVIETLGQVTHRDGMLCWAAFDRVNCATLDERGFISDTRTVARTEDVRSVCAEEGSTRDVSTAGVTS